MTPDCRPAPSLPSPSQLRPASRVPPPRLGPAQRKSSLLPVLRARADFGRIHRAQDHGRLARRTNDATKLVRSEAPTPDPSVYQLPSVTIRVGRPAHLTASFDWFRTLPQDVKDDGVDRFRATYLPVDHGHHEPNEIRRATGMIEINPVTSGSGRPLTSPVSADLVASILTGAGAG